MKKLSALTKLTLIVTSISFVLGLAALVVILISTSSVNSELKAFANVMIVFVPVVWALAAMLSMVNLVTLIQKHGKHVISEAIKPDPHPAARLGALETVIAVVLSSFLFLELAVTILLLPALGDTNPETVKGCTVEYINEYKPESIRDQSTTEKLFTVESSCGKFTLIEPIRNTPIRNSIHTGGTYEFVITGHRVDFLGVYPKIQSAVRL